MSIREVITFLEQYPREMYVPKGFDIAHSYRGYYEDLGVCWVYQTTVGAMIDTLKGAIGSTYEGWKGGLFTMEEKKTDGFVVNGVGCTGEPVSTWMLQNLMGDRPSSPPHYTSCLECGKQTVEHMTCTCQKYEWDYCWNCKKTFNMKRRGG
jgi:hypothetical protein